MSSAQSRAATCDACRDHGKVTAIRRIAIKLLNRLRTGQKKRPLLFQWVCYAWSA
jgi:hypothetical protein